MTEAAFHLASRMIVTHLPSWSYRQFLVTTGPVRRRRLRADGRSACFACNNGLAPDEEYVAALIECVIAGDVDPAKIGRPKIAKTLINSVRLAERLRRARRIENGHSVFDVEQDRLRNVVMKLARGHASYELNDPKHDDPDVFWVQPLSALNRDQTKQFEDRPKPGEVQLGIWPEVGSRIVRRQII